MEMEKLRKKNDMKTEENDEKNKMEVRFKNKNEERRG